MNIDNRRKLLQRKNRKYLLVKKGLAESRGEGSPRAIFAPTIAIEYRKALAT